MTTTIVSLLVIYESKLNYLIYRRKARPTRAPPRFNLDPLNIEKIDKYSRFGRRRTRP